MNDTFRRLHDALGERYLLEREIGAGGMATVYLARDLRHRRPVAVKVVRPELGGPLGVDRFLREIELAARLQHPHILPVFDSGVIEPDGAPLPYFVMPYVEGETLRERLQRAGPLPVEEAVALAGEIADALAYAHRHGVVHRDVKPENILLSGGHAMVADFGVAKAIESGTVGPAAGSTQLTAVGVAIGTPQYMSPEQAAGREAVDARADQYSLGCVLYEMLVGRPPFDGAPQAVVMKAMTAPRPRAPALADVVARAMAAQAEDRYPDMAALAAAIRTHRAAGRGVRGRWALGLAVAGLVVAAAGAWLATRSRGGTVDRAAEAIMVLPFSASGPGVEFLGEGMVDLLAANLNGVGGIYTVDPRTVIRRWDEERTRRGATVERALAVARDLGAASVVVGSAVSAGGHVRLGANLYSVGGAQLGRAQVDGPLDSVLPMVDRLSLALLRDVWRSREPMPTFRLAAVTTDSLAALRAYLLGERHYRRLTFDSALVAFTRAVEIDSTFALAHFRRALAYGWIGGYGSDESVAAAAASFRFAHRLPPRDRRLLDHYRLFERGKPASVDSLRAFVAENPGDLEARYLYAEALHHTRAFTAVSPDTIVAAFDSVLARDSSLIVAALHPLELGLHDADSVRFRRYASLVEPAAPAERIEALRAVADLLWGTQPSASGLGLAIQGNLNWILAGIQGTLQLPHTGSDTVLHRMETVRAAVPRSGQPNDAEFHLYGMQAWSLALAGFGRLRESLVVAESLAVHEPLWAAEVVGWPVAMGLTTTPSAARSRLLDSLLAASTPSHHARQVEVTLAVVRGDLGGARVLIDSVLAARDTAAVPAEERGLLRAMRGWAALAAGDSVGGIRQLREGLDSAAAPRWEDETSFLRFQLALALVAREETRAEGIRLLRYAFGPTPEYVPLGFLALGRAWETAGEPDSAAFAYGRFLQLWDKADPEVQDHVREAREALQRLTSEPRREGA